MPKTLSESDAWNVLRAGKLGHLGCIDGDGPYVVPINYLVQENSIYSHSLPGRKISELRANARACPAGESHLG